MGQTCRKEKCPVVRVLQDEIENLERKLKEKEKWPEKNTE